MVDTVWVLSMVWDVKVTFVDVNMVSTLVDVALIQMPSYIRAKLVNILYVAQNSHDLVPCLCTCESILDLNHSNVNYVENNLHNPVL